jgi:TRAP-type C4-dicarboxylate transport system permease small subunit
MPIFLKKIKSLDIYIYKYTEWIGIILLFSIFIMLLAQVIFRYIGGGSLPWTEEVSTFFFIWVCLIGANLGLKNREHLGVLVFISFFPSSIRNWITFLSDCLIGFFAGYLFVYGWRIAVVLGGGHKTPFLNIPYTYMYLSVSVGGFLLIIQDIFLIKDDIKTILFPKTSKSSV